MLALEWSGRWLRVVQGKVVRGKARLGNALQFPVPEEVDMTDPVAFGQFIGAKLDESGISGRRVVSCVDRRGLILKRVSLVGASEEEIADLVRLQAMRELTIPIDETIIDYLVQPGEEGLEPQAVLAVVRKEIVEFHQKVVENAGRSLAGLWPSSLAQVRSAAGALVNARTESGLERDAQMLLVTDGRILEISLLQNGRLVASAARPIGGEGEADYGQVLLQAIRRVGSSLLAQFPNARLGSICAEGAADVWKDLGARIEEQFEARVFPFDPLEDMATCPIPPADRGAFAGTVGSLLLDEEAASARINFLAPKKKVVKPDRRRILAILGAGVAAFVALMIVNQYRAQSVRLTAERERAVKEESRLAKELRTLRPIEEEATAVSEWRESDVVWLKVLDRIWRVMPESRQAFLTSINLSRSTRAGSLASIRLEGYADLQQTVTVFDRALIQTCGFEVRPGPIQPANRIPGYAWHFSADLEVPVDFDKPAETADKKEGASR